MATLWDVLVPAAATNLVINPSFETNTTGWTAVGGTITRTAGYSAYGAYSLYIASASSTAGDGAYYSEMALTDGTTYTASAYLTSGAAASMFFSDSAGTLAGTITPITASSTMTRLQHQYSATASANYRLYFADTAGGTNVAIYLDGVQVEAADTASTYIDGDQPGCTWAGVYHGSTSTRKATERSGGNWTELSTLGVYVTGVTGLGVGDQEVAMSEFALRDGGEVRQTRTPSRNFTLTFDIIGSTLADLHDKRQAFINYLHPRRYGSSQPVYLRYRGSDPDIVIKCWYEGGLTYSRQSIEGFTERCAARFILEDDPAQEVGGAAVLDYTDSLLTDAGDYAVYNGSAWTGGNTALDGVTNGCITSTGLIYMGALSTAGDTTVSLVSYNGSALATVGAFDEAVYSLVAAPNNDIYIGGTFTAISGTTVNGIAKYDGDTFTALDAGVGGLVTDVRAIAISATGNIYAGGSFTQVGSTPLTVGRLAMFNGDTWAAVPASSTGGDTGITALAFGPDGCLYAGGTFTTMSTVSAVRIAKFDGTTWTAMGAGFNNAPNAIVVTPDGTVYAGGPFTDAGGGEAINYLAKWNGSAWSAVSSEINGTVYSLAYRDGILYIGGYSSPSGSSIGQPFIRHNGKDLYFQDIYLGSGVSASLILPYGDNKILIGGTFSDTTATVAHVNTITTTGSAETQPVLTLVGTTSFVYYWLENQTTGQRVYFNLPVLNGERVEIDFLKGTITSNYGRNLYSSVLSGSDFGAFRLVPGANSVASFGTGTGTAVLTWKEREVGI